jgi:O-Antigen ligase
MTARLRGTAPFAAAAIVTGALVPLLPGTGQLLLVCAAGLGLAVVLIGFRARGGHAWHPALVMLTGLAVVTVTWNGVPPTEAAAPDLFLLAALAVLAYLWAQDSVRVPIPGWLIGAAACLFAAQLIAQLFVPEPPVDQPPSFTPTGSAFVTLARVELGLLIVPILIGAVASSWERAGLLADLFVVSAAVSAVVGIVDSVTGAGIGVSITSVDPEAGRVAGLAIHSNAFALTCAMAVPIALLRAAQLHGLGRVAAVAGAGLLLMGILSSGSRVGLLSAVLAIGLMGLLIAKLRGRILAAGLAAVAALVVVASVAPAGNSLFSGFDRLSGGGTAPGANSQRIDQFRESLDIAIDYPVTGVGFQVIADAHSLPIQFWEAAGFLGVLAMILYVTGVFSTGFRLMRNRALPNGMSDFAGALTISFAVWLISGLFQNQIADRYIYVPVGLLLGLTLAARARTPARELPEPKPALPPTAPPSASPNEAERVPVAS